MKLKYKEMCKLIDENNFNFCGKQKILKNKPQNTQKTAYKQVKKLEKNAKKKQKKKKQKKKKTHHNKLHRPRSKKKPK